MALLSIASEKALQQFAIAICMSAGFFNRGPYSDNGKFRILQIDSMRRWEEATYKAPKVNACHVSYALVITYIYFFSSFATDFPLS